MSRTTPQRQGGGGGPAPRVAVLVAVAALVVATVASFAVTRSRTPSLRPTGCGVAKARCIPSLESAAVIGALKSKGYGCTSRDGQGLEGLVLWECVLRIGATKYSLNMGTLRGHVNTVLAEATVQANKSAQGGKGGTASGTVPYLLWFASLPFADDLLTVADVKAWLTRQVQAGKKATVNIAGYRYEVDASKEGAATFDMQGMIE